MRGVKEDFSSICEIPVRLQTWTGWPAGSADSMVSARKMYEYHEFTNFIVKSVLMLIVLYQFLQTLSLCGLTKPVHNLTLRKTSAQGALGDITKKVKDLFIKLICNVHCPLVHSLPVDKVTILFRSRI